MAIKNTKLGGTDWVSTDRAYYNDLNDTFDATITKMDEKNSPMQETIIENAINITKIQYDITTESISYDYALIDVFVNQTGQNQSVNVAETNATFSSIGLSGNYINYSTITTSPPANLNASPEGTYNSGNFYVTTLASSGNNNTSTSLAIINVSTVNFLPKSMTSYAEIQYSISWLVHAYNDGSGGSPEDHQGLVQVTNSDDDFLTSIHAESAITQFYNSATTVYKYVNLTGGDWGFYKNGSLTTTLNRTTFPNLTFKAASKEVRGIADSKIELINFTASETTNTKVQTTNIGYGTTVSTIYFATEKVGTPGITLTVYPQNNTTTPIKTSVSEGEVVVLDNVTDTHLYTINLTGAGKSGLKSYGVFVGN